MITNLCNNKTYLLLIILVMISLMASAWFFVFKKQPKTSVEKPIQFTSDTVSSIATEIKSLEPRNDYEREMLDAAQKYWQEKGSNPDAKVILRDFGCHVGVEAVKDGQTVSRLQYDGSVITEIKED